MANNNIHEPSTGKRGRPPKFSVELFLLDPDNHITKVTQKTCSKEGKKQLMEKGYGPPKPECCKKDGKVEFSLELTNEQFKQKLVEIYPKLKNACFVFMRADKNNKLEDLNPGRCCFRCYTPENIHNYKGEVGERRQGKLYIRKIAENEISPCTHEISRRKRLCGMVGSSQQHCIPIKPKPVPALPTSISVVTSVAMPTNRELPVLGAMPTLQTESSQSGNMLTQSQSTITSVNELMPPVNGSGNLTAQGPLPASTIVSQTGSTPPLRSSGNMVLQSQLPTSILSQTLLSQPVHSSVNMVTQRPLPSSTSVSQTVSMPPWQSSGHTVVQSQLPTSILSQTPSSQPVHSSVNMVTQRPLPSSAVFSQTGSSQPVHSSGNMVAQRQLPNSTIVFETTSRQLVSSPGNMAPQNQLPALAISSANGLRPPVNSSVNMVTQNQLPIPTSYVAWNTSTSPYQSPGNMVAQESTSFFTGNASMPSFQIPGNMVTKGSTSFVAGNASMPSFQSPGNMVAQGSSYFVAGSTSMPSFQISGNMVARGKSPMSTSFVPENTSMPSFQISGNMVARGKSPMSTSFVADNKSMPSFQSFGNMAAQGQSPMSTSFVADNKSMPSFQSPGNMAAQGQSPMSTSFVAGNTSMPSFQSSGNTVRQDQLQTFVAGSMTRQERFSSSTGVPDANLEQPIFGAPSQITSPSPAPFTTVEQDIWEARGATSIVNTNGNLNMNMLQATGTGFRMTNEISGLHDPNMASTSMVTPPPIPFSDFPASDSWVQPPALNTLAAVSGIVQREQHGELLTRNANTSNVQGNLNLPEPNELRIKFLENVELTEKLEISLAVLDNEALLKKLNESTINIHTVEIQSTCEVHKVLSDYSLPSCLKVLRINDNNLNYQDIFALVKYDGVNSLQELDLSRTKFKESTFIIFVGMLDNCSNLTKLFLTDNGLTKQDVTCLTTALCSMKCLKSLNLSKSNLSEIQANDILQIHGQAKNTVFLDLSQNALQGNEIIIEICQLQSLEELNLSHNKIRFFPLPNLEEQCDNLPVNTKTISLAFNHMTPKDIHQFFFLIRSDLLKLNLDFNHVGNSIWSLCSRRIKHLKVLSLVNTDVCGAVDGLVSLLSKVGELEELNLSSNNLMLKEFQQLQSPLSKLSQLKRLDLSNNPEGLSALLPEILPSLKYLEKLSLSNIHLNGDDLTKICDSLASLKGLKYLDISMNAIGPVGTRALANILKELSLLEELDVSRSYMTGGEISVLCNGLVPLKELKYLNLSGNRIDIDVLDDGLFLPPTLEELNISDVIHGQKLFAKMVPLKNLRKLHLTNLKLRDCHLGALAHMLPSFPKLEVLSLAHIVVPDSTCEKIFSAIKLLKFLRKLDLRGVKVRDGKALFDMLSSLTLLEEIVFPVVALVNADCINFSALESLRYLKNLDLCGITKITETCVIEALLEVLPSLQLLEKLVLGKMYSDEVGDKQMFAAVRNLRYLKELDLGRLWIVEIYAETLAEPFLEKLVLAVLVCDDVYQSVFAALEKLNYLKELDLVLDYNTVTAIEALAEVLPSLQLLEKLVLVFKEFDLDECSGKQLFAALGKLRYLKELSLEWSYMIVTDAEVLAEFLPSLQLLEKLDIYFDNESVGKQFFVALGKLRYLKELSLTERRGTRVLFVIDAGVLVEALQSLQLLEKLVLGEIYFGNESVEKQLFAALGKLRYLKELNLGFTSITETGAEALAEVLPSLQLLEKLVFGVIVFENERVEKQLFAALGKLRYLKEVSLERTFISVTGAEVSAEVLPSLQLLEKLVLRGVVFGEESEKQLFAALGKLRYLNELALRRINISATGIEALAEALTSLQLLETVILDIDLRGKCHKELFAALGKLGYRLKELRLYSEVRIEIDFDAKGLAEMLPSLQLLEKLDLGGIHFKNGSDQQLFNAVRSLSCLKELNISSITITQIGALTLADVLPTLHDLKRFELPEIEIFEDYALRTKLKEKARLVPGLKVYRRYPIPGMSVGGMIQMVT